MTVWPTTSAGSLWSRLLATFTRPGDLVIAVDPCPELVRAAALDGHHFTGIVTRRAVAEGLNAIADQACAPQRGNRLRIDYLEAHRLRDALTHTWAAPGLTVLPIDLPSQLLTAAAAAVPIGRYLVVACDDTPDDWAITDGQRHALDTGGLRYLQHIVAVEATLDADIWIPTRQARRQTGGQRRQRIHHDWYVFTRPGVAA